MRPSRAATLIVLLGAAVLAPVVGSTDQDSKQIIRATMPAVVMVMAVNSVGGQLQPVASGSGTIIDSDGSVLTNYHVLNDAENSRLYDMFVIARFRTADREPEMVCAGRPAQGRLKPELDLALIKCDMDLSGQKWTSNNWPTIPVGRSEEVDPGQQLWVLGYPNIGGGTIHVTAGAVSGWWGEQGGPHRAFIKTDAMITHGNSGGTAVDTGGHFIGVPTAIRFTTAQQGDHVATVGKMGLIRPIEHARDLIAVAQSGWIPGEAANDDAPPAPPSSDTPAPRSGVVVTSKVIDAANKHPVPGAFVIIFEPGTRTADITEGNLESLALSWGRTNAGGVFELEQRIPRGQRYAVAVLAGGYEPLAVDDALSIADDSPDLFDPWGEIRIVRE